MTKKLLVNILVCFTSIFLALYTAEGVYRLSVYLKHTFGKIPSKYRFWISNGLLYDFDQNTGFRHRANLDLNLRFLDRNQKTLLSSRVRTNNLGHIGSTYCELEKPKTEYRIVVLGDSFTACVTNNLPWSEVLEQSLNKDERLKRRLGCSSIKVINLGMEGTGIVQWGSKFRYEGKQLNPDLVIVNFVSDDITRRFVWLDTISYRLNAKDHYDLTLTCTSLPVNLGNAECKFSWLVPASDQVQLPNPLIDRVLRSVLYTDRENEVVFSLSRAA